MAVFALTGKLMFGSWEHFQEACRISSAPRSNREEVSFWASLGIFYYLCLVTYKADMGLRD